MGRGRDLGTDQAGEEGGQAGFATRVAQGGQIPHGSSLPVFLARGHRTSGRLGEVGVDGVEQGREQDVCSFSHLGRSGELVGVHAVVEVADEVSVSGVGAYCRPGSS